MADADQITKTQVKEIPEQNLKYLEFVQVAALHLVLYVSQIYDYAKENSGPLKTGVQTVEGTVKTVVGPVYQKFHDVPNELLKFVDRKVDDTVNNVESHIPPVFKQMSSQARSVASEVKNAGLIDTASELAKTVYVKYEPIAKGVYNKYEPVAEHYAVSAWHSLNNLPLFPQVAQAVIPTATYVTERYNQTVIQSAKKGFKVASYLPLVPTEKIAKVFNNSTYQPMSAAGTKTIPNDGGVAAN